MPYLIDRNGNECFRIASGNVKEFVLIALLRGIWAHAQTGSEKIKMLKCENYLFFLFETENHGGCVGICMYVFSVRKNMNSEDYQVFEE